MNSGAFWVASSAWDRRSRFRPADPAAPDVRRSSTRITQNRVMAMVTETLMLSRKVS